MVTATLSTKVYNRRQLELVEKYLKPMMGGLEVETKICKASRGWIQLTTSGEDEDVAIRYLADKIGTCPMFLEEVDKFSTIRGYISSIDEIDLYVDIGIYSPIVIDVAVPLRYLQAQLVDGRKMALERIVDLFGFVERLPLIVKIRSVDEENNRVEAMLSEKQLMLHRNWTKSLLDRLVVLGASSNEVEHAVRRARIHRYVINVESFGMLEHAVVCNLGTDAVGLIPKIGRKLPNASFAVFDPKKILKLLGDYGVL